MKDQPTLPGMDALMAADKAAEAEDTSAAPRLRRPDRNQALLQPVVLEELLPANHQARIFCRLVEKMDLARFEAAIKARGSNPGRASADPRMLIALWIYAYSQGVGSARELDRLCHCQDAYRWLCGGVSVNYHSLSDFQVDHGQALQELFEQAVMHLVQRGLVKVDRVSQDGVRVRASAGSSSFRKGSTLQKLKREAREHLEGLEAQADDRAWTGREKAARKRAAQEQEERIDEALAQIPELEKTKESYGNRAKHAQQKKDEPRASTTDPEARKMKMADGGFRPAYNVQLVTAVEGRAILAVEVNNVGSDRQQSQGMRAKVEEQTGQKVKEHLMDGGYVHLESIEKAGEEGVTIYAPVPAVKGVDPALPKKGDGPQAKAWRKRMSEEAAKAIYKQRASTSETVNADLKTWRGMDRFGVRGIEKVTCVALRAVLAYNLMHFGPALLA